MGLSSLSRTVHGVLVSFNEIGVLVLGESGVGKSGYALELLLSGHSLIADDVVLVERVGGWLIGRPPECFAGLLEIRGVGIVDVRKRFGPRSFQAEHRIDVCLEFCTSEGSNGSVRHDHGAFELEMLGLRIPKFSIHMTASPAVGRFDDCAEPQALPN